MLGSVRCLRPNCYRNLSEELKNGILLTLLIKEYHTQFTNLGFNRGIIHGLFE